MNNKLRWFVCMKWFGDEYSIIATRTSRNAAVRVIYNLPEPIAKKCIIAKLDTNK